PPPPIRGPPRQHEAPRPIPLAQPAADRGKERADQIVHRQERPNGADPPAEGAVGVAQRGYHDPRRLADGAPDHLDYHQYHDDDPTIVEAARVPDGPRVPWSLRGHRHCASLLCALASATVACLVRLPGPVDRLGHRLSRRISTAPGPLVRRV